MDTALKTSTRDKLLAIIGQIVTFDYVGEERLEVNDKLHIILSESIQALALVTTIEDEFDFEFDDEEIDLDFFMDFEKMLNTINKHVCSKN